jgi:hypothetical protein
LTTPPKYPRQSYYDLLGVSPTAGRGELRAAYLRRMDQARANGSDFAPQSKLLNEAYEVLLREPGRAAYDRYLAEPATNEPQPAQATPPGEPRTTSHRPEPAPDARLSHSGTRPSGHDAARETRGFDFAMSRTPSPSSSSSFLDLINSFQRRKYRIGRKRRRPGKSALIAAALAVVVVGLITYAVSRHKANEARQAADHAAGLAAIEQSARASQVDCYVALTGSGATEEAATHKHYPCTGVPLSSSGVGDSYSTVITVKGVSTVAADQYGIWLFCTEGDITTGVASYSFSSGPGVDLRVFLSGTAGQIVDGPPRPIDCAVRDSNSTNIRTTHIVMKLDPRHRFKQ